MATFNFGEAASLMLGLQRAPKMAYGSTVDLEKQLGVEEWVCDCVFIVMTLSWYFVGSLFFKTEKQRAYVITLLNCIVSVIMGVYVALEVTHWDWSVNALALSETPVTRLVVRFFRIVQILDVAVGLVFYPSQLFMLTTWIHHTCYTLLCNWMLTRNVSVLFTLCLLEELPTLIMALGRLDKRLRSDVWFGLTYGALRVGLHTLLVYNCIFYDGSDDRIHVVRFNFGLTWCLHANWFIAWINQQVRIQREASSLTIAKELKK